MPTEEVDPSAVVKTHRAEIRMGKRLPLFAIIVGAVCVLVAWVYALIPANRLPSFVPGSDPNLDRFCIKHGVRSLVVGAALWGYAWVATRPKRPIVSE